jgi:hypothetical protein
MHDTRGASFFPAPRQQRELYANIAAVGLLHQNLYNSNKKHTNRV